MADRAESFQYGGRQIAEAFFPFQPAADAVVHNFQSIRRIHFSSSRPGPKTADPSPLHRSLDFNASPKSRARQDAFPS
jgi:hypothetical protein